MTQPKETRLPEAEGSTPTAAPLRLLEVFLNHLEHRAEQAKSRADFYQWLIPNLAALLQTRALLVVCHESTQGWQILGRQEKQELSSADELRLAAQIVVQPKSGHRWSSFRFDDQVVFLSRHTLNEHASILVAVLPKRVTLGGETQLLEDLCGEVGTTILSFERSRHQTLLDQKLARTEAFVSAIQHITTALSQDQWARFLVNDLANLLQFDRVSWFRPSGKPIAVSGVTFVGRHSKFGGVWRYLVRAVARSGRPLDHTQTEQPDCSAAAKAIWERSLLATEAHEALIIPLIGKQDRRLGVLVCESFHTGSTGWSERRQLAEQMIISMLPFIEHSARLLNIPGLGFRLWIAENVWSRPVRSLAGLIILTLLLACGQWLLFGVPRRFDIPAKAELEPITRTTVFAATPGKVDAYLVSHEEQVTPGTPLVRMSSLELEQELTKNQGLLAESLQNLTSLQVELTQANHSASDRVQTSSEMEQVKIRIEGYREIEQLLQKRISNLAVVAPSAGQALLQGFDQELLNRPVPAGEALLEIADTSGPWRLRAAIEERYVGYITQQQQNSPDPLSVRFRLVTHPTQVFSGRLETLEFYSRLEPNAESSPTGQVTAYIHVDRNELGDYLRLGTGAWVRIECGEATNWFLLTYELRDKIREWFFY